MGLARLTIPTREPLELSEAKLHLGVTAEQHNSLIQNNIQEARDIIERFLDQSLAQSQWRLTLNGFPSQISWIHAMTFPISQEDKVIRLPRPPLLAVDSIEYLTSGQYVTLSPSAYVVDTTTIPGIIYPAVGTTFPSTDGEPESVKITFTAGVTSLDEIPFARALMRNMVYELYVNRGVSGDDKISEIFERLSGMSDYIACV